MTIIGLKNPEEAAMGSWAAKMWETLHLEDPLLLHYINSCSDMEKWLCVGNAPVMLLNI